MFTRERLTRWTNALRANPEQQMGGKLASADCTRFCCLGKLAKIEGIEGEGWRGTFSFRFPSPRVTAGFVERDTVLAGTLADEFGSTNGDFHKLGMPRLFSLGKTYETAASANDQGVSWIDIADHFDEYYPCSDEVKSEKQLQLSDKE